MAAKKITIETSNQKYYFEIDEYGNKYHLYEITYSFDWLNSKKRNKTGETKSMEDAITLAKISVSGSIKKIEMD